MRDTFALIQGVSRITLFYSFQEKDFGFVVTALAVPRWTTKVVTTNKTQNDFPNISIYGNYF